MPDTISFDGDQLEALGDILEGHVADLRTEIADSNNREYLQVLKAREELVNALLGPVNAQKAAKGLKAPPRLTEREVFLALGKRLWLQRSWSAQDLLKVMQQVLGKAKPGKKWQALEAAIPTHEQWPRGRLIALLTRVQNGEEMESAGFGEMLHAGD